MTALKSTLTTAEEGLLYLKYVALTGDKSISKLIRYRYGLRNEEARMLQSVFQKETYRAFGYTMYKLPPVGSVDVERLAELLQGFASTISVRYLVRLLIPRYRDREELIADVLSYTRKLGLKYRRKDILKYLRQDLTYDIGRPKGKRHVFRERHFTRLTLLRVFYRADFRTREIKKVLRGRTWNGMRQAMCDWFGMPLLELRRLKLEEGWSFYDFLKLLREKVIGKAETGFRELYRNGCRAPRDERGRFTGHLNFCYERVVRYVGKEDLRKIYEASRGEDEFAEKLSEAYWLEWLNTYYSRRPSPRTGKRACASSL